MLLWFHYELSLHVTRLSLHPDWCGLRDEELSRVSGIEGCVFVHANGFIGGNLSYQGALAMAVKTIETCSAK